jgi:hypothetical protein
MEPQIDQGKKMKQRTLFHQLFASRKMREEVFLPPYPRFR